MNVIDIVDKYNLTLIKLPTTAKSVFNYNPDRDQKFLQPGDVISDDCIKRGVSQDTFDKLYNYPGASFRNGDVYRLRIHRTTVDNSPRWRCFANDSLGVGTTMTLNKKIFEGATPEAAVQAFLDSIKE